MSSPSRTYCNDDGESDELQERKKGPMVQEQVRAGGTPSPVAGRRRLSSGSRKSPGKSLARSRSRRDSDSHHRGSTALEGEQESAPQMKRNHSYGSQLNSRRTKDGQESTPQMKRNHSFGRQLKIPNSSHRRSNKSHVSNRDSLPAMNGGGASQTRDRTDRKSVV